jgi:hypothetical protein
MGSIDDFIRQAEEDELKDATKLPPIQYAKLRGIYPQKVYAAIRSRKLEQRNCDCGRKIVVVKEADEYFKLGAYAAQPAVSNASEEEASDETVEGDTPSVEGHDT